MKKFLPLFSLLLAMLLTINTNAQQAAKRYVMFEHFTNASCGPCATQNPTFDAFYSENKSSAKHITFHTAWPGTDPMNALNPSEVNTMVSYYGVTGVPNMRWNGSNIGGPAGANASMLDVGSSPIRINVAEVDNGDDTRTVTVEIQNVGDLAAGDYILRLAVVEDPIVYSSAPGSNGETHFPNVFRKWIANDVAVTIPAVGESTSFQYTYDVDAAWNAPDIYPLAYLVNTANKEVINAGSPSNLIVEIASANNNVHNSQESGNSTPVTLSNLSDEPLEITLELTGTYPSGWDANFTVDGNTYTESATIMLDPGAIQADIHVTPNTNAGVGKYTLTTTTTSTGDIQTANYVVIHDVTDLIVVKSYNATADIATPYSQGLATSTNTSYGDVSERDFLNAIDANQLADVKNIYLSVGWIFPALSNKLVYALENHLDNGGNLLIAGQDIGWDIMSGSGNGTPVQQVFYSNYLSATYDNDGAASSNSCSLEPTDAIFGGITGSSSIDDVWTGGNLYPDQISPNGDNAHGFLTYNTGQNGAIRAFNNTYKTVYLGIGLEHFGNQDIAHQIMKLSHDWFYSTVSTEEFDALTEELSLGQNSPNPADNFTTVQLPNNLPANSHIIITDITGKQVIVQNINTGATSVNINTQQLQNGVYFYQLHTEDASGIARKMIVTH